MPTYIYECDSCKARRELLLRIVDRNDPLSDPCPDCGSSEVRRVVGGSYAFMEPEALGRKKAPAEFRDWLRRVKKANPGSTIKDR